jgi:hypothetical protein
LPLITMGLLVVTFLQVRQHYVLDSERLEHAINNELQLGSSKTQVLDFIEKRHPLFCDDLGSQVKVRLSGLAGNMIYRKDVVLIFEFDSAGKLLSHSTKVYLTFL